MMSILPSEHPLRTPPSNQFLIKCCLPSLHVLFAADFSKVSARNQQGDSKGAAREQQGNSKETAKKFWPNFHLLKKISPIFGVVPEETILQAADNQRSVC